MKKLNNEKLLSFLEATQEVMKELDIEYLKIDLKKNTKKVRRNE